MAHSRRSTHIVFDKATSNGDSGAIDCRFDGTRSYTASLTASAACKATLTFYGSTVGHTGWTEIGTLDLELVGAGEDSASFAGNVPWNFTKATLVFNSGSGSVSAWFGA